MLFRSPALVQRCQERAYSFIRYAPIHDFVEGPVYSDDEEEEGSDDDEDVDEEIEADKAPDTAADTATETAAESSIEAHSSPTKPITPGASV